MSSAPVEGFDGPIQQRRTSGGNAVVSISAALDYALRALCTLATAPRSLTAMELADAQELPHKFLEGILSELTRSGVLTSRRGADGGYRLARPPDHIVVSEVVDLLVGTLVEVRGHRANDVTYQGAPIHLSTVWVGLQASVQAVLDQVTIADIVAGRIPFPDTLPSVGS
jgi:Rrf2 family protein